MWKINQTAEDIVIMDSGHALPSPSSSSNSDPGPSRDRTDTTVSSLKQDVLILKKGMEELTRITKELKELMGMFVALSKPGGSTMIATRADASAANTTSPDKCNGCSIHCPPPKRI